jgi:hypothetical protein
MEMKDLVIKLNDRNIQRQRESGLTFYAIISVIVIDLFMIINNSYDFFSCENLMTKYQISIIVLNFLLTFIFLFLGITLLITENNSTKLYPNSEIFGNISYITFIITLLLILLINIYFIVCLYSNNIKVWFLIVVSIILLLNIVTAIFLKIKTQRQPKNKFELPPFTMFTKKMKLSFAIWCGFYFLLLITLCIFYINSLDFVELSKTLTISMKFGFLFFGLFVLINVLAKIEDTKKDNEKLEDLEIEIFTHNLSSDDIKVKLKQRYIGIDLSEWLSDRRIEIIDFFNKRRQEFLAYELLLNDLKNYDPKKLKYEFLGRLEEIKNKSDKSENDTLEFHSFFIKNLKTLQTWASLNEDEIYKIKDLRDFYNGFTNEYVNSLKDFTSKFKQMSEIK